MRLAGVMLELGRLGASLFVGAALFGATASAETASLVASADSTLIESASGARSNGAGPAFFVGRNSQARESIRRGLVRFDVAEAVPPGMIITRAELVLVATPSNPQPALIGLHRVLSPWGEGASSASGGSGAPSEPGDATWIHTFHDWAFWSQPGGDFVAGASVTQEVGDAGVVLFPSTPEAMADVQAWLDLPEDNHGWLLRGNEDAATSAKRFASREAEDVADAPRLLIEYQPACDTLALRGAGRALCHAYCEKLDCDGPDPSASPLACGRLARQFLRREGAALPCERAGALPPPR